MTTELTKAAQQALMALRRAVPKDSEQAHEQLLAVQALNTALTQRPAAQTEREAFEAWARPNGYDLRRNDVLGHYSSIDTSRAWSGFRAGRASLHAPQQATPASAPQSLLMRLAGIAAECSDPDTTDALDALIAATQQATPEPLTLGPLAKRNIYDAIRGAYDLGYNDARNARTVPGDSAPGYDGRSVEEDHGGALFNTLNRRLAATPEPVTSYTIPTPDDSFTAITYQTNDIGFFVDATEAARKQKALFFVNGFHDSVFGQSAPGWSYTQTRKVDENTVDIGRVVAFEDEQATPEPVGEPTEGEFFAWDAEGGIAFYKARQEAINHAKESLRYYRDGANDHGEWDEDVEHIRWGVVMQRAEATNISATEDGESSCDYELQDVATHPAPGVPEGFALEGWMGGVESAAKLIQEKASTYAADFGHDDDGLVSFGTGRHAEVKFDHYISLIELADEVRALAAAQAKGGEHGNSR